MANTIAFPVKYLEMLDRIYKASAVTSVFEVNPMAVKFSSEDERTVYLKEMVLQGLGAYTRDTGYDAGTATISWRAYTMSQERSKKFNLDVLDAREAYTSIVEVAAEFERVHVGPEIDAYRMEKLCTDCGLDVSADLTDDTVIQAIDTGIETLNNAEVPQENRVLMVSNNVYNLMKQSGEHFNVRMVQQNNGDINRNITIFDDMPVLKVPSARFYNNFDFATSGAGGFTPNSGAKALNFVIAYLPVIAGVKKHVAPKIIKPEFNADADGWIYAYRLYHDLFVPEQKKNGIYIHSKA
jgi:hypothetical protein